MKSSVRAISASPASGRQSARGAVRRPAPEISGRAAPAQAQTSPRARGDGSAVAPAADFSTVRLSAGPDPQPGFGQFGASAGELDGRAELALAELAAFSMGPTRSHDLLYRSRSGVAGNSSRDSAILGGVVGGLLGGLAGAAIGFAVGGPIGALIGGLIGLGAGAAAGAAIGAAAGGSGPSQGATRTVDLQPVTFRDNAADPAPTGASWANRLSESNVVWGKLGVQFNDASPVVIDDPALKTSGKDLTEYNSVVGSHSDASKVCVFITNNDYAFLGGAGTIGGGAAGSKIAMSDFGTSNTLLAHELGHTLGLDHPPAGADENTIMTPSGSHSVANPTRNTLGNYNRIVWPAAGAPTTINPDP